MRKRFSSARASWHYRLVFRRCCQATSAASLHLASPALARASRRLLCQLELLRRLESQRPFQLNASKTTFYELWRHSAGKHVSSARAFWRCLLVFRQCCLAT